MSLASALRAIVDDVHLAGEKRTVTRVFLSYSRKDQDTAVAVRKALEAKEVEVFRDLDNTLAGEEWWVRITELISAADAIIFLLSPDSARSPMCGKEVDYAQGQGKRILSAVLAEVDWSAAPPGLSKIHSADLRRFHADPNAVDELAP
jgi:hypothetical protein